MTRWPCSFPELIGGTPSLKMNHGSGTLVLQLANNIGVADRRWHRLDVRSNSKVRETQFFFVLFPTPPPPTPGGAGTEPSRRGGMITHVRVPAAAEIDPASLAGSPALIYRRCASRSIDAPAPSSWRRKVWTPG